MQPISIETTKLLREAKQLVQKVAQCADYLATKIQLAQNVYKKRKQLKKIVKYKKMYKQRLIDNLSFSCKDTVDFWQVVDKLVMASNDMKKSQIVLSLILGYNISAL